jgi:hypothetical protein
MLKKSDIITELLTLGCSIEKAKLNKMKKTELELILRNYSHVEQVRGTRRPKETDYDFSSSESESEESEEEINITIPEPRQRQKQRYAEPIEEYIEPEVEKPKKRVNRTDIKQKINSFTDQVNVLISGYRQDKDIDYMVDQYNILYQDLEYDLNSFLSQNNASDADYNYADSLLQVQNNRIKRLVK